MCIRDRPKLNPEYTPVAPSSVQPLATEGVPSPSPTEEQPQNDALGRPVEGEEHYTQYLTFNDVQVYEQASDTFVDAYISNSYPKAILCAVTIRFLSSDGCLLYTSLMAAPSPPPSCIVLNLCIRQYAMAPTTTT